MAPRSFDEKWETYEQEFAVWLESEIEATRQRLEDLLKIKKRFEERTKEIVR